MSRFNIGSGLIAMLFMLSAHSNATSFDCVKASSFAEKSICTDSALSRLDEALNSEYVRSIDRAADKAQARQDQREWLRRRDNCKTANCVASSMTERLNALARTKIDQPTKAPTEITSTRVDQTATAAIPKPVASAPAPATVKPVTPRSAAEDHQAFLYLKIGLFVMAMLLLICIYLHRRGTITIYQDYTDALWTSLTPILGIGAYFVASLWLEVPRNYSIIAACVLGGLMSLQVLVQTYRSNGFWFFLPSLFAKVTLLTFYFLMIALLLCGGARTKSEARRRRGLAVLATTVFVFLSGWICRNRQFSSIDDYIAGRA
ncbi:lysozyme inhibitor LprI family protein [Pseudomonas sp. TSRC2-2]|uniref:lysozyme inhibitor LprI family protein n=1 Tax=Pseudomonas sp. TSRC2-2 TaxID=2804571 RepID=UPI003CF3893A